MTKQELNKIFDECYQITLNNSFQSKEEILKEIQSLSCNDSSPDMSDLFAYSIHKSFKMNLEYINLVLSKIFLS